MKRLKLSPTKLLRERVTHVHRAVDPKGGCTRGGLTDTIHGRLRLKLSPTKLLRERDTHVHRVVDPKGGCTRGGLTDTMLYLLASSAGGSKLL